MAEILQSLTDGVLQIVMHRPDKKNALTAEMYLALRSAFDEAARDAAVKVVLLSGAGGVFTAGNDLDDFIERPPKDADAPVFRFLRALAIFEKPVVAAVEGLAIGIGTTMLLHCDLVYASEEARFALPFVTLGLVPEAASSLLLPALAGYQRAAEKLLLGDAFPATEAQSIGFVNRLLPKGEVKVFAEQQARRLASLPAGSVVQSKSLMRLAGAGGAGGDSAVLRHMDEEIRRFGTRLGGASMLEAIAAFKAKRKPVFDGLD